MSDSIAIVGMACRYPDADNPDQLWENVIARRRAFRRLPQERLRIEDYYSLDREAEDAIYSTEAAVLEGYIFDRTRFRVSGKTFRAVDMTHWLALEVADDALEDADFSNGQGLPKETTGVLLGNSLTGEFSRANLMRLRWPYVRRVTDESLRQRGWDTQQREDFLSELAQSYKAPFPEVGDETLAGGLSNTISGRICNYFDFKGGGYTVDGACASSLLAISTACSSLVSGDLDVALAGGVDLSLDPFELIGFSKVGALAQEEMKVYDKNSSGFWPGEGCGVVVLMRLEDALAEKRYIYATIKGWGISSDGSGGITRPEIGGQSLALKRAYKRARFGIETVGYFEGHGTGTSVGDETELSVLSQALRNSSSTTDPTAIGSIKANIGHTKAAAGVAGLIKAALIVKKQIIPATTSWNEPHPALAKEGSVLQPLREGKVWPADEALRAGVSAMGFGGINAHIVLEGTPSHRRKSISGPEHSLMTSSQDAELFLFGGSNAETVKQSVEHVSLFADRLSRSDLTDLSAELSRNVLPGKIRAAIVATTPAELSGRLETLLHWLNDGASSRLDLQAGIMLKTSQHEPRIGYLFTGQGSPANLDGGAWRRRFPTVDSLYEQANLPQDMNGVHTEVAQPAIVTASLAGIKCFEICGIQASVAIGHSLGELTAYHWAGAIDESTAVRIAKARGTAVRHHGEPGGAMASICLPEPEVHDLLIDTQATVASINSPCQTVVSGTTIEIDQIVSRARKHGIGAVKIPVSHAFHSPLVAKAAPELVRHLKREKFNPLQHTIASTVTGGLLKKSADLLDLLEQQMTSPVRFMQAFSSIPDPVDLWVEMGPGEVLNSIVGHLTDVPIVSVDAGGDSLGPLLRSIGAAFALGFPVQHSALLENRFTRSFDLNWSPKFLANPCEQAPTDSVAAPSIKTSGGEIANETIESKSSIEVETFEGRNTPKEILRKLISERVELPLEHIKDEHRLLNDLHLSSIAVGQLIVEASSALNLSTPEDPTDAANATVAEIAQLFTERLELGDAKRMKPNELIPKGVDSWIRLFAEKLVERPLLSPSITKNKGTWKICALQDYPLREELLHLMNNLCGNNGVMVCLPQFPNETHIYLLLQGVEEITSEMGIDHFVLIQHGGGAESFARSLHLEFPDITTTVVDVPWNHPRSVEWIEQECLSANGYSEIHYDESGKRFEPVMQLLQEQEEDSNLPFGTDDVLLVSGGGKGIAAECALKLAKDSGIKIALLGRSQPEGDQELAANLKRLTEAAVNYRYFSVDVTDSTAIEKTVNEIESALGPITAFLHGAGTNNPQPLSTLSEGAFQRTLLPKYQGARNILAALDPDRLKLLITFGSIIARTGMHGQADYAVANQWLTRLTEQWQEDYPHCKCLAIEWSVWSGVGMGEKLGKVDALRKQGITPIGIDEGIHTLCKLLRMPLDCTSVIVTSRFGEPPTLKCDKPELPLLRFLENPRIHVPGVELVVESHLSLESDLYLNDHVFQGSPLLPAVFALEAMAQVAMTLYKDDSVPVFEEVKLTRPVVVSEKHPVTIRIAALVRSPDRIEVVLRSQETDYQVDHFRAVCRMNEPSSKQVQKASILTEAPNGSFPSVSLKPLNDLYGCILFHTGRFQRLKSYKHLRAMDCIAEISLDEPSTWFGRYLPGELVLGDPAARDSVIHSVQACIPHATLLPIGIERLEITKNHVTSNQLVHAQERSREDDIYTYDIEVTDESGDLLESWNGLQLRRVSEMDPQETWPEPLLGPYIARRVEELIPGPPVSVAVERTENNNREKRSELLIQRALGKCAEVYYRGDGKPEVNCSIEVSTAHADDLTIAISGDGPIACDAEPVKIRSASTWQELLGAEKNALAELITRHAAEDKNISASRVWTAVECLKKAGAGFDNPLLFHSHTEDGWVLLNSGSLSIASWVSPVRGSAKKIAFAVLVRSDRAEL